MTPERWERIKTLFRMALELDAAARSSMLARECHGDADLGDEVSRMLAAHEMPGTIIAPPEAAFDNTLLEAHGTDQGNPGDLDTHVEFAASQTGRAGPARAMPELLAAGTIVDGKYRIDSVAGRGGMGVVYRATQLSLNRTVAVKVLYGDEQGDAVPLRRFRQEAHTVAQLKHPNIVAIHDFGLAPDVGLYFAMEYLEGRSLRAEIPRGSGLPLRFALDILMQVCAGVQAAHEAGVVHRDIKPDNIFLETMSSGFLAKVLDFGIAKGPVEPAAAIEPVTHRGALLGTPAYLSPEQCAGDPVDERADIYALGCVLYEMLAGRPPFIANTVATMLYKHVAETPEPLSAHRGDVPAWLEDATMRALAKRPGDRFQSVARFARTLAEGRPGAGGPAVPLTLSSQPVSGVSASRRPSNLPEATTSFVGREREIANLANALDSARLVTLCGPGGIGKTRLSLETAARSRDRFAGGVWLADLTSLRDAALVERAVADALGIRPVPGLSPRTLLHEHVANRAILLVLDNCEHLIEGAAATADALLKTCPDVRILATSREPLGVHGEVVWRVPPLPVAAGVESESERLFLDRALLARPNLAGHAPDPAVVSEICRRLEGIPLAIELAAARMRALGAEQILARLDRRFELLAGGGRTRAPRQQALRAAIDWSFDMLPEPERALFRRVAVFAGGWTLEAAEGVCAFGDPGVDVLDLTTSLIDKSLVSMDERAGEARYRMLETLREYALEKLDAAGERERTVWRYTRWYQEFARRAELEFNGTEQAAWFARADAEIDNIRAVLAHTLAAGGDEALKLCCALRFYLYVRGHLTEGRRWFDAALAAGRSAEPAVRAMGLYGAGGLALGQSDIESAGKYLDECLALYREIDDGHGVVHTLLRWAFLMQERLEYDRSVDLCKDAIAACTGREDRRSMAVAMYYIGRAEIARSRFAEAETWFNDSMAIHREANHQRGMAILLHSFGELAYLREDLDGAEDALSQCIELAKELGDERILADSRHMLGCVATVRGDVARALDLQRSALATYRESADSQGTAYAIEGIAGIALAAGDAVSAVVFFEAAERIRDLVRAPLSPAERLVTDRNMARAAAAVEPRVLDRARARGRGLREDQTARMALDWAPPLHETN